ncbi:uncharacterized protein LOC109805077 [Cajanus cajan]|uniref:uncharacterized protein LOC109805077 n=1 Tax=Cajanus cajan TaxID=3821 RepID=UPI00098DB215|nr:uncharacterized protein LOC109805077 [Cajanus cajan]
MTPSLAILLSLLLLLLLLTLSHARNLQTSFPEPQPKSEPQPHQHDTVSFTVDSLDPLPLTLLRFRPINRRFHPLPLGSRCRHAHRRQIAYGNDMIQLSQIRPRWARVHAADVNAKSTATVEDHRDEHHRHNHHRHYHHHVREESLFAKKIREFLNLF